MAGSAVLFLAALAFGCASAQSSSRNFTVCTGGVVRCRMQRSMTKKEVNVRCRASPAFRLVTCESLFAEVSQEVRNFTAGASQQNVSLQFDYMEISLYPPKVPINSNRLHLIVNDSIVSFIDDAFFSLKLVRNPTSVNVRFVNVVMKIAATNGIQKVFDGRRLGTLELMNVSFDDGGHPLTISNLDLSDRFLLSRQTAGRGRIRLENITAAYGVELRVESGLQQVQLRRLQPGILKLTGVRLDSVDGLFVPRARLIDLSFSRCSLPAEADRELLVQLDEILNEVAFRRTELANLPLCGRFHTKILTVADCRLDACEFERLRPLEELLMLSVTNTTLDSLPRSFEKVTSGSLLWNLHSFDLSSNRLRTLPQVKPEQLKQKAGDMQFVVKVKDNPLHCNCSLQWLGSSSNDVRFVFGNEEPRCWSPPELRGEFLTSAVRDNRLCPVLTAASAGESSTLLWAAIVAALLLLLCIAGACLHGKCRNKCGSRQGRAQVKYSMATKEGANDENQMKILKAEDAGNNCKPTNV